MRTDPRLRQTWNDLSQNLDAANQNAQANIFTFSQEYVNPCLSSVNGSLQSCLGACFPPREERLRRSRARHRGPTEYSFDFYDDWEDDDGAGDGLLGWGSDELDRLLAGSGAHGGSSQQYGRPRTMSYGARRERDGRYPHDGGQDPTVIPKSSVLGFLGRLPWKMGKDLRYRPSAADLQDRPGKSPGDAADEPLLEGDEGEDSGKRKGKDRRGRSSTSASDTTTDSFRSRGDLFPSDDEDDAVPLDDEFAVGLERRTTGSGADEASSRAARKKSTPSRQSTRTDSSRETRQSSTTSEPNRAIDATVSAEEESPDKASLSELKAEEERARREEEVQVEQKREAARDLARSRGLSVNGVAEDGSSGDKSSKDSKSDAEVVVEEATTSPPPDPHTASTRTAQSQDPPSNPSQETSFVGARLPSFPSDDDDP